MLYFGKAFKEDRIDFNLKKGSLFPKEKMWKTSQEDKIDSNISRQHYFPAHNKEKLR